MYRQTGAGDEPHAPAFLCMVLLLQGYVGASDAEAVEMSVMDRRWQLVLDCLDAEEPPFSQGALQAFRERMIGHDMDRVLLERTAALVREGAVTKGEGQQLSKAVRVAIDSRPLAGTGRVEDTLNLGGADWAQSWAQTSDNGTIREGTGQHRRRLKPQGIRHF